MNKKLYIFLFLVLGLIGRSLAQENIHPTIGKPFAPIESSQVFYVAHKSGFLAIHLWANKLILQKFGTDLTQQKALQYENFPKELNIEKVLVLKGKCYILYSAITKGQVSLYVARVDMVKGELIDGGKEIVSPSDKIDNDIINEKSFQFLFSTDSSYFAVCYRIKSNLFESKNNEVNGIWVFNDQLTERWHSEFAMPYTEKKCNVRNRGIDTNGNVHMVLTVIKDESGLERKAGQTAPNYSIEILSYQSPSEPPKITSLNLDDKFLNTLSLAGGDKLICSGFYNTGQEKDGGPEGIFAANILYPPASGTVFLPFPLTIVNEGEKKSKQKSNEKLAAKGKLPPIEGLEISQIIPQNDGGLLLLGEQRIEVTTGGGYIPGAGGVGGGGGRMMPSTTTNVYINIIVARLLPDLKLSWIRKLIKDGSGQMAYRYQKRDNMHNLLFTEEDKLFGYGLNDITGDGEKKLIVDFDALLKRPQAIFSSYVGRPVLLPEGNGVIVPAFLKGDAGKFGESKPYKEDVLIKVTID